jgi:PAS domain S-box-containing protein
MGTSEKIPPAAPTVSKEELFALQESLREREKELNCLTLLSTAVATHVKDLAAILKEATGILAGSWLHTDTTVARITFDGEIFETGNLDDCVDVMQAALVANGQVRGEVAVGYLEAREDRDEGPFLKEERTLLDLVAERLGHVTERIEVEVSLDLERKTLKAITEAVDEVIYVADPETHELIYLNRQAESLWGKEWRGKKCHKILQGLDEPCPFCSNDQIFGANAGKTFVWEFQNQVTKDWFRCADKAIPWNDGRLVRFELATNITEIRSAVEQLKLSEAHFRTVTENAPDMIYRMSLPDGRYEYVSPASEQVFGHPPQEFLDNPLIIQKIIHPDWVEFFQTEWARLLAGDAPPTYEYQIMRPDGETRWINQRNVLICDEEGNPVTFWGIASDVTENRKILDSLEESRRALVEHQESLEQTIAQRTADLDHQVALNEAINRIFREALIADTEEQVGTVALRVAEEFVGGAFGFVGMINAEGTLDTIALSNPGWDACQIPDGSAAMLIQGMEVRGIWAKVIRTGESRISNRPDDEEDRVGVPAGHPPLTSFLGVGLREGDRTVGLIALANKEEGFAERDREDLEHLSFALHEVLIRKRMEIEARQTSEMNAARRQLSELMSGNPSEAELCRNIVSFLCRRFHLPVGLLYLVDEDGSARLGGGYSHPGPEQHPHRFAPGEGLVGQALVEKSAVHLTDLPAEALRIESGLLEAAPDSVHAIPILYNDQVQAVLELGAFGGLSPEFEAFIKATENNIAVEIVSVAFRRRQRELLEETQDQAQRLQVQQEELKAANEELESQTERLTESQGRLRTQQEELEVTNEELEEKNRLLDRRMRELEKAGQELQQQSDDLARASRYKSEFLANMSHELRTPLSSLLLLARALKENKEGNLNPEQVQSAEIIHKGGNELLVLINDILDLSKIESGRVELQVDRLPLDELVESLEGSFTHVAREKGLEFAVTVEKDTPEAVTTDRLRLGQVLKNLVGNALKFTQQGSVLVTLAPINQKDGCKGRNLGPGEGVKIVVKDTGIGISEQDQQHVFEAFRQADGGMNRRYGGTGLGLSISRELILLLGGEIRLSSEPEKGSEFTVFVPLEIANADTGARLLPAVEQKETSPVKSASPVPQAIADDRERTGPDNRPILIIEDDPGFAQALATQCRESGLLALVASSGEEGVDLAVQHLPVGILLDIRLPGIDGWRVLELLKDDERTRHIPVHVVSGDEPTTRQMGKGAIGYVRKPVTREAIDQALTQLCETAAGGTKRVLVVEDDPATRQGILELLGDEDVVVEGVGEGEQALAALRSGSYDCMVLDLGLQDMDGIRFLDRINEEENLKMPPVIVYTGRDLTWDENVALRNYSDSIILKNARSDERLLDEVTLFLHRVVADLPDSKRKVISSLHDTDAVLRGKKVLLVDDDMRNLFALSRLLSERGVEVLKAENGEKALELLANDDAVDLVLMDIMMPVMDGFETMRRIRAQDAFARLPIIALTAKAMKGDQENCLAAGANDYMTKPVDPDRLLSLMRVWMYR